MPKPSSQQKPLWAWAVSFALAVQRAAAVVTYCPSGANEVCFSVGIPEATVSAGSGNIYFSIVAPTSYQWVALGAGAQMAASNIFVVYQDGQGNVTLSPRLGQPHVMPTLDTSASAAQLTLLAGSGVADGVMTANVRCANCESWNAGAGSLALASTSAPWIGAWKSGSSLATTSRSAAIRVHDGTAQYNLDMTKATIASDSNPFVTSGDSSGSGSGSGSGSTGSGPGSGSGDSSGSGGGGVTVVAPPSTTLLVAHGAIMAVVMVGLYPFGAALMPLVGNWLVHGLWQGLAYLLMWAGFGLGIVVARQRGLLFSADSPREARAHTIMGTVAVAALGLQPLLGLLHHRHYVRAQRRGLVSHVHIWWGRLLLIVGIVNGGIGLHLAQAARSAIIGYSVVAAVFFVFYVAAKALGSFVLGPRRADKRIGSSSSQGSATAYRGSRLPPDQYELTDHFDEPADPSPAPRPAPPPRLPDEPEDQYRRRVRREARRLAEGN